MKKVDIEESWYNILNDEFEKEYFHSLRIKIRDLYKTKEIYPNPSNIFNAFNMTPFQKVKAVIIGQDPYHGPNQAHGLCFSVNDEMRIPPSLQNIFKELKRDLNKNMVFWLTGLSGSGKTTTSQSILKLLQNKDVKILCNKSVIIGIYKWCIT